MDLDDPFRHLPGLRDKITPPQSSFFWTFAPEDIDALAAENGFSADWRRSSADIDARLQCWRAETMPDGARDLWVFGYGSLMWDPGFAFAEVRRARIAGLARRFSMIETLGGRGMPERPGIMAVLDAGPHVDGLAYRIAAADLEPSLRRIWYREMIADGYRAELHPAETAEGPVTALAFVADHACQRILPNLPRADQIRYTATGAGVLGTSLAYVENLAGHFAELDIDDPEVTELLVEARAYLAL